MMSAKWSNQFIITTPMQGMYSLSLSLSLPIYQLQAGLAAMGKAAPPPVCSSAAPIAPPRPGIRTSVGFMCVCFPFHGQVAAAGFIARCGASLSVIRLAILPEEPFAMLSGKTQQHAPPGQRSTQNLERPTFSATMISGIDSFYRLPWHFDHFSTNSGQRCLEKTLGPGLSQSLDAHKGSLVQGT